MEVLYPRCAGLDVHAKTVVGCVRITAGATVRYERRTDATTTRGLLDLLDWLIAQQVTHVAMEATGVYGKPVWHVLEGHVYLDDPDGNGLEIYADRPRAEWPYIDGQVQMTVDPMDMAGVLAAGEERPEPWRGLPTETAIGHVHFTVSDPEDATAFYRDVIGFDVTMRVPTLTAVSAGGYHHHVNLNTWAGEGAGRDTEDMAGLIAWELSLPDDTARAELRARLEAAGVQYEEAAGRIAARDPDGILFEARSSP